MQPGFCQAGSLCLVSGMDEETMLGHFTVCLITVLLVCFALTKIKIKYRSKLGGYEPPFFCKNSTFFLHSELI